MNEPGTYKRQLSFNHPKQSRTPLLKEEGVQHYGRVKCLNREAGCCMPLVCDADWTTDSGARLGRVTIWPDCKCVPQGECPDGQDGTDPESIL